MSLIKQVLPKLPTLPKLIAFGAVALAATFALPDRAKASSYTMKISTSTINELQHQWAQMYKEKLEQKTNGEIEVQIFPASQLGPIGSVIEGVQLGSVEATLAPYEFFVGIDRRYQIPGMPGLYADMDEAYKKLTDPKVKETLMNLGKDTGVIGLTSFVYGPQLFITKTPINTLKDFKGKKIRVLASDLEVEIVKSLGAAPVPMPLNEVSSALQQGAIDGANNLYDVVVPQKMYTFAPYIVETDLWFTVVHVALSEAWLQQLPKELQAAVFETAKELEPVIFQHQLDRQKKVREAWSANKGKTTKLSQADAELAHKKANEVAEAYIESRPELGSVYELIRDTQTN